MNIYLKPIELEDGKEYCDLLIELARYEDAYARPVPSDFEPHEFESFKATRVKMASGVDLPSTVTQTNTYWVMDDVSPIGYATLKHKVDLSKPGGHFGCCLKKEYQNKGIGKELVHRCINACESSEWLVQTDMAKGFYEKIGFKVNEDFFLTIPCKLF